MKKHLNKTMVEFVKEQHTILIEPQSLYEQNQIRALRFEKILNYANALSQTPRLGHFIPCDENDVPLEEPKENNYNMQSDVAYDLFNKNTIEYQQACERVLFEGCKYDSQRKAVVCNAKYIFYVGYYVVYEDLIKHNLPLTDNGAKFFGL